MSLVGFTLLGSIEAPSLTGAASDVPLLVKPNTEFTVAMLASLDVGGGDLRFSSDEAGTTQLACEIVDGLDVVWVSTDGLSVATGLTIYVWGDNTGASQPAVGAAFGRNAVWVDLIGSADFYSPVTSLTNKTGSASGSVNGSPTLSSTSPFGSSWNFTSAGGSDYVDVLSGFAPSFASNFSISTVFSFDSVTIGSDKRIWGAENTALNENLAVGINTDTDTATKLYSAGETAGDGGDSTVINAFYWHTLTWNGSQFSVYKNGSLLYSVTPSGSGWETATNYLSIGGGASGTQLQQFNATGLFALFETQQSAKTSDQISIEYDNQSETGSWWIAADADTGLTAQGFTLLGSIEAPSLTGSASDVPLLVKPNTEFTVAMLASLDVGGGDLRFSSDAAGLTQLACEIVDGLDVVWVSTAGLSVATGLTIHVWGDNTGASQPAVGAAFGRNAVWVDYRAVYHLSETANTAAGGYLDSTGNGYDGTGVSMSEAVRTLPSGLKGSGFDGTADYINMDLAVFPTSAQTNYTVEMWGQPDSTAGLDARLLNLQEVGVSEPMSCWMDVGGTGDGWAGVINVGTIARVGENTNNALAGRWDFVTYRRSGSTLSVAKNGVVSDSSTITGANTAAALDIATIGAVGSGGTRTFMDGGISEVRIRLDSTTDNFASIEYQNQSAVGAWWIAADAGGAISVTESLTALTIDSFNPSIDFTGVVSVTESPTNLNLNSFNPTIGLTATLTVTESLTNLEFNSLNPVVTLTPPNTIIVTEATTSLTIDSFDPTITFSGTISVTESLTNLDFRSYRPAILVGEKDYSNIFYGVASQQVTFTGTSVSSTFSGTIKQAPDFSGIIKTSTFSGVSK